jgi:hypothetical protein
MIRALSIAVVAFVCLVGVVGCASSSGQSKVAVQALEEKASAVRLQATVFEMRLPPEKIGALDAMQLATMDLSKLPPEMGESRALYVVDQKVSLAGDRIMVGTQEPMVTNTRVTNTGQKINTVQYNSVGAIVEFKAERTGPRQLNVTSTIEVAAKTESSVEIGNGVNSSVIRKATLSLKGPVELGKPSVLISGDASSRDKDGKAVVYIARIVLGADAPAK